MMWQYRSYPLTKTHSEWKYIRGTIRRLSWAKECCSPKDRFPPTAGKGQTEERRLQKQRLEQTGAGTRQSEHLGGKAPLGPRPQKRQVSHSFFIHRRINSFVIIFTYKVNSNWIISASQYRNMKKKLNVTINTFLPLKIQSNLDSALSVSLNNKV